MRATTIAVALAVLCIDVGSAGAQTVGEKTIPPGTKWTEAYVASADGTKLHVDLLLPADRQLNDRFGVLLVATSYGAHSGATLGNPQPDPAREGPVRQLALIEEIEPWKRGIAVAYADMRGFGASEGCVDFGGDDDRSDALALIEWAASQDWSNGRVVLAGLSYAGIPPLLALADPPRALKGVVPLSALGSMYRGLYMNRVHYEFSWYATASLYQGYGLAPGTAVDETAYHEAWARGARPECLANHHREQKDADPTTEYWRERDWGRAASGARVPVLAGQGLFDPAVKPDDFLAWWRGMRGWRSAWIGQYLHGSPVARNTGREGFAGQLARFLATTLLGSKLPAADRGVVVQEAPSGRWRRERRWPPRTRPAMLDVLPGAYADMPGNRAEPTDPAHALGNYTPLALAADEGVGSWTFSPPLDRELHLAGEPSLRLRTSAATGANLIALLYDVRPDGTALLISRGATRLDAEASGLNLYPQDWRLEAGHRIGLLLTGSDELWWGPQSRSLATVEVLGATLRLPTLGRTHNEFLAGTRGPALEAKRPIEVPVDPSTRTGSLRRP